MKTFRMRIFAASGATSLFAATIMVLYIRELIELSDEQVVYCLEVMSPVFFLLFGLFIVLVLSWIRPIEAFESDPASVKKALEAREAALFFPLKACGLAVSCWMAGAVFIFLISLWIVGFDLRESFYFGAGIASGGLIGPLLAYYFYRMATYPVLEKVSSLGLDPSGIQDWGVLIRRKLLVAFVILLGISLSFSSLMSYEKAFKALRKGEGRSGLAMLREVKGQLLAAVKKGGTRGDIEAVLSGYAPEVWGQLVLLGENGETLWGRPDGGLTGPDLQRIMEGGEGSIMRQGGDLIVFSPLEFRGLTLAALYSSWIDRKGLGELRRVSLILLLLALGISAAVAFLGANDVSRPVNAMLASVRRIAGGSLEENIPVISDDEVGDLAQGLRMMAGSLRSIVGSITDASRGIENAVGEISTCAAAVSQGSERQRTSVGQVSSAMTEMDESLNGTARHTETLFSASAEASSSEGQLSASIEGVAGRTEQLAQLVDTVASSTEEMAASVRQVAENVGSVSAFAEKTALAMGRMDASLKEVHTRIVDAVRLSETVGTHAHSGGESVLETISAIQKIAESAQEVARVISSLEGKAGQIGDILSVIDGVAEETNLLALNAAIIAAQAGEHGKGFAVVADEIRDLAERTAASTKEIDQIIRSLQGETLKAVQAAMDGWKKVEGGIILSRTAGEALEKIRSASASSSASSQEIARVVQDLTRESRQVSESSERIAHAVEEIARAVREQAKGAVSVARASEEMRDTVLQFKKTTQEQARGSVLMARTIENIKDMANFIHTATEKEEESGHRVTEAVGKITEISGDNFRSALRLMEVVSTLKDRADFMMKEVGRFRL